MRDAARMRRLAALITATLIACSTTPSTASPASSTAATPSLLPSLTAFPTSAPSPSAPPVVATEYKPRLILSVPYSTSPSAFGATTARVGGLSPLGVTTFAVDEQERIYVWDRARLRIAVFEQGKLVRSIPAPYMEPDARSLLADGGRLYMRFTSGFSGSMEYELDAATGALLRVVRLGSSIYPRPRSVETRIGFPTSGDVADALGNHYDFDGSTAVQRYRRIDASGAVLAYTVEPLALKGIDMYARRDGALYELASDWGGAGSAYVYMLMPAASAASAPAPSATAQQPFAFGRSVPDSVLATLRQTGGSAQLDLAARTALWWLAATAEVSANVGSPMNDAVFEARWNDGTGLIIGVDGATIGDGLKGYITPTRAWAQLAGYAIAAPARLAAAAQEGAVVGIADLPGSQRALSAAELAQLRASLGSAFSVSEGELPGDLELPFPVYELRIGDTLVQLRRDHHAAVGRFGAFAHDGALYAFVRRAMPVPALAADQPRSLFLADKVTIAEDGYPDRTQDISRWKASIVRALVGVGANLGSVDSPDLHPLTLTFAFAGGRTETVRVLRDAYTYRGVTYARPGVIAIIYLRGVP